MGGIIFGKWEEDPLKTFNGMAFIHILLTVVIATRFTYKATSAVLYLHVTGKATKWTGYPKLAGHTSIKVRTARDHTACHSIASHF